MYSHGFPQGYLQRSLSESLLFIWQLVVVCYVPSIAPGIRDVSLNKTDPKPSLSPGGAYSHFFCKPTRILGLIAAVSQMLRPGVICFFLSTIPRILGHKYLLENPFPVWGKKKDICVSWSKRRTRNKLSACGLYFRMASLWAVLTFTKRNFQIWNSEDPHVIPLALGLTSLSLTNTRLSCEMPGTL